MKSSKLFFISAIITFSGTCLAKPLIISDCKKIDQQLTAELKARRTSPTITMELKSIIKETCPIAVKEKATLEEYMQVIRGIVSYALSNNQ